MEPVHLVGGQALGLSLGVHAGPEEGLVGVDVAEAGHPALVHEQGLDLGGAAGEEAGQAVRRKVAGERFGTESGEEGGEAVSVDQPEAAEAAGVVEVQLAGHAGGVEQRDDGVGVLLGRGAGGLQQQPSRSCAGG